MSDPITVRPEIQMTGKELGALFARLDAQQQAEFWIGVGEESKTFYADLQWLHIRDELATHPEGRVGVNALQMLTAWYWLHWNGETDLAWDLNLQRREAQ